MPNDNDADIANQPRNIAPHNVTITASQGRKALVILLVLVIIAIVIATIMHAPRSINGPKETTHLADFISSHQPAYTQESIVEDSLRFHDMDGDGAEDVVGFVDFASNPKDHQYTLKTWFWNGKEYRENMNSYSNFGFSDNMYHTQWCSISNLSVGRIRLICTESDHEYPITLRYQKDGSGHYRDVDADVVTFDEKSSWSAYTSTRSGIRFKYPPDAHITEKTYSTPDGIITLIRAEQRGSALFEIHTTPVAESANYGGGIIDITKETVYLRLSDGSYLSRDWTGTKSSHTALGVFYSKTYAYQENDAGSVFSSYNLAHVEHGRKYTLFTPLNNEQDLRVIDEVFSSIQYVDTPIVSNDDTIKPKDTEKQFGNAATVHISGNIVDSSPITTSSTIDGTHLKISFIPSLVYKPTNLYIELSAFNSVGGVGVIGGGGYDINKGGCFEFDKDAIAPPQTIGDNKVCRFGYGDAGLVSQGYYILDPNRKYILSVAYAEEYDGPHMIMTPDLEAIVRSVRFTNQ